MIDLIDIAIKALTALAKYKANMTTYENAELEIIREKLNGLKSRIVD